MNEPSPQEKLRYLIKRSEDACSAAELCEFDIITRLTGWQASPTEVDDVIEHLKQNGFIDNLRYAKAFSVGKNHQLKWGRLKIAYQLRMKRIDNATIEDALLEIDEERYMDQLLSIAQQKWRTLRDEDRYTREGKLSVFLQGKGYETYAIKETIKKLE